ncbi:MAG TPA: NAD(P)-binding domain-containing protein [Candidatus Binatus sp.]|nr:NAD(P)-binding domain-containing protein [Candidatus Binatus sp.]
MTAVEAGASLREVTILVIGIIGSGKIGSTVARLAVGAGHDVVISNSRGPDSLSDLVASLGPHARAATVAQAVRDGDIVVIAIPFRSRATLFGSGVDFRGKIVVDAMNAYTENFEPMDLGGKGSSELVAQELPGARVVKAFNTLYSKTLASAAQPKGSPERIVLPLASDDADAKRVVASFIDSIGYQPFDNGSLVGGRRQQPETALYNKSLSASQAATLVANG